MLAEFIERHSAPAARRVSIWQSPTAISVGRMHFARLRQVFPPIDGIIAGRECESTAVCQVDSFRVRSWNHERRNNKGCSLVYLREGCEISNRGRELCPFNFTFDPQSFRV